MTGESARGRRSLEEGLSRGPGCVLSPPPGLPGFAGPRALQEVVQGGAVAVWALASRCSLT